MKKFFTILMLLAVAMQALAFENGYFKYTVLTPPSGGQRGTVTCTGLSAVGKSDTNVTAKIPYLVNDASGNKYYVTEIQQLAFQNCTNIAIGWLSYGIKTIGSMAFSGCSNMTTLVIPSSVKKINSQILQGYTGFQKLYCNIYDQSTNISNDAFAVNKKYYLDVPDCILSSYKNNKFPQITNNASTCNGVSDLGDFLIDDSFHVLVTSLNDAMVTGFKPGSLANSNAKQGKFVVPATITPSDYDQTFSVTTIGSSAFAKNTKLVELDLSQSQISTIQAEAARDCHTLTTLKMGSSEPVTIMASAFSGCTALNSVNLDNVQYIEAFAFNGCTSLTSIRIPASVKNVSNKFVDDCTALKSITVDAANPYYSSYGGSLYDKNQTMLYKMPQATYSGIFPATLQTILDYAAKGCSHIGTIYLPYGLRGIGNNAFDGCTSLLEVRIPSSVSTIGEKVFNKCTSITNLYCNMNTPISLSTTKRDEMFGNVSTINLYVPRDKVDAYKNAGWTGFNNYNKDGIVAYDTQVTHDGKSQEISTDFVRTSLSITSNKAETINGVTYNGRAKVVRGKLSKETRADITIPPYVQFGNKKYAITRIDDLAYKTDSAFYIKGCALVDTVGKQAFDSQKITSIELPYVSHIDVEAFDDCKSLTSAKWGNRLQRIEKWGFCNAPLAHNIYLPVGFKYLGYQAFKEVKSKVILVPSTMTTHDEMCFNRMQNTTQFIINAPLFSSGNTFDFDKVPTSATILVPVGQLAAAKAHKNWKRFNNIKEGAFDFSNGASLTSIYTMTVTSTTPVTVDGVTYAGKAMYVYNPQIKSSASFTPDNAEVDKMCLGSRKYLMTAIGDSTFYGASNMTEFEFTRMAHLESIGRKAFTGSGLTSATMPANAITFGRDAFYGATSLTELVIPGTKGMSGTGRFFGNNAQGFNLFVDYSMVHDMIDILQNHTYSSTEKCSNRVAPCFTAIGTTFNMGVDIPLDFSNSDLKAYAVTGKDNATGLLKTSRWYYTENNDGGVIITDLTPNTFYKVKRKATTNVSTAPGLLKNTRESINLQTIANSYYWDFTNNKFVKVTGKYTITSGRSYLVIPNEGNELYLDLLPPTPASKQGDVNGDGTIDVTDVNLTINVMLGKESKSTFPASDVNGDGTVDVTDVNLIINIMLGK